MTITETNLSENIINIIKKTHIFEKVEKCKNTFSKFIFFTSIMGTAILFNVIYNTFLIKKICNKNTFNKDEIKALHNKLDNLLESNSKVIALLEKNNNLEIIDINNNELKNQGELKNENEDELENECYDNIPCNNSKKVTGLNRLFNW